MSAKRVAVIVLCCPRIARQVDPLAAPDALNRAQVELSGRRRVVGRIDVAVAD